MAITLTPIGVARTPYQDWAPHQPLERKVEAGAFRIVLADQYRDALFELDRFSHIIVVSYLDRVADSPPAQVAPPWAHGRTVGLFASRSPVRPCPLGLSVVELLNIEGTTLFTSPLDLLDETPVLDLKPYIPALDSKVGASSGWIEQLPDHEHLLAHLRGAPHDHGHHHDHGHDHDHHHDHDHGHHHGHAHDHQGKAGRKGSS